MYCLSVYNSVGRLVKYSEAESLEELKETLYQVKTHRGWTARYDYPSGVWSWSKVVDNQWTD